MGQTCVYISTHSPVLRWYGLTGRDTIPEHLELMLKGCYWQAFWSKWNDHRHPCDESTQEAPSQTTVQSFFSTTTVMNTESCGEMLPGGRALKAPRFAHRVERATPKFKGIQLPQRTQMARDHTWTWQGTATSNSPLIPSLWRLLLLRESEELS